MREYRIGTRGSDLALWQAHFLQDQLSNIGVGSNLHIIKTQGDKIQDLSFDKLEGKGFFTKEIEDALLNNEVDIAVHSMKDLPTEAPEGLTLAAVSYREDPRDLLLSRHVLSSNEAPVTLPDGAVIGTSSARRKAQILELFPHCQVKDLRGNVPTRVNKLRQGQYDAILLAKAGIDRLKLDLDDLQVFPLHVNEFVPAPAQGVLAFQCRLNDLETRKLLLNIHHADVAICTNIERKVLNMMDGGCHLPLGVHVYKDQADRYQVSAAFSKAMGQPLKKISFAQTTYANLESLIYKQLIN